MITIYIRAFDFTDVIFTISDLLNQPVITNRISRLIHSAQSCLTSTNPQRISPKAPTAPQWPSTDAGMPNQ